MIDRSGQLAENGPQRRDGLAVLLLLLLATISIADILFLGSQLYERDLTRYHYPMKRVVRETLLAGDFPYWNRFANSGQPMAANPAYEVFYPPQLLVLLPDYNFGFRLHIVFHIFVALLGMYFFLRSLESGLLAALTGAVAFGLGPFLLSTSNTLPFFFSISWIPLILLTSRNYVRGGRASSLLVAAVVLALQFLVGEPVTMIQTIALIVALSLAERWVRENRFVAVDLLRAMAVVAAAVSLAAVQLIPAVDHAAGTVRQFGFQYGVAAGWSTPPVRFLELFVRGLFGPLAENGVNYWGAALYPELRPFYGSLYAGLIIVAAAVAAAIRRLPGGLLALSVALLSFGVAAGSNGPFFPLLYRTGVLRSLRFPEKFALTGVLILLVMGSLALGRMFRGDSRLIRATGFVCGAGTMLVVMTTALLFISGDAGMWALFERAAPPGAREELMAVARAHAIGVAICSMLATTLLFLRERFPPRWWASVVALVVGGELALAGRGMMLRAPGDYLSRPPVARIPVDQGRIFHEADHDLNAPDRVAYFSFRPAAHWVVRNGLFPNTAMAWGYGSALEKDIDQTQLFPSVRLSAAMSLAAGKRDDRSFDPFLSMSNVGWKAVLRPFKDEVRRVSNVEDIQPVGFERLSPEGVFYFADRIENVSSLDELVSAVSRREWTPRTAAIDRGNRGVPIAKGKVLRTKESSNEATAIVETTSPGLLVISITRHKYWKASVDGVSARLLPVNLAYQGLVVPSGRHVVTLRYRNPLIAQGAFVSILALALLAGAAMVETERRGNAGL